jgi:acyl carrier protein
MPAKQQVKRFILTNYLFTEDESKLPDEASLIKMGALDSTGVLELIAFLEEQFQIKVEDDEMVPANLDSVAHIVEFVQRKQAAAATA